MLRAGYFQFRPLFGKVRRNLDRVVRALDGVDADLVVLPELAFTGYHFRDRDELRALAEDPARSPVFDALRALCRARRLHLVAGFAERRRDRLFNSAALVGPRGIVHIYRKLHLFNDETTYFDRGDTDLAVQTVAGARIGMMVCFDWAFPEVARVLALKGADILCQPSNLVLSYCQQTMLTRCLENRVFAITTNRHGADQRPHGLIRFTGRSQITAPGGVLLHRGPAARDELYLAAIDPGLARDKAITPRNDLIADRRPAFYGTLTATRRKPRRK
jgi:predicted amidohydrolase